MIVICLEGCHGSGKTELCKHFQRVGFKVLDENFLDMPSFPSLHPQSLVMETIWVTNWIQRLLKIQAQNSSGETSPHEQVYVVDRSPYSAVFYAQKNGHLLSPLIQQHIKDLEAVNIHILTVYIKVDRPILWERISERLKLEPERKKYKEDSREWMETTVKFYEDRLWDMTVQNNRTTLTDLMHYLIGCMRDRYARFPTSLPIEPSNVSPTKSPSKRIVVSAE
eukprot:Phypoly_transcript_19140.p1 GENE.Phypoly_transcript_19140~~Phypoly_transcript_19140.p1  ORF type:complete len:223 (+),score=20.06 Phypoly_transcript_19140:42-710(+)